MVNDSTFRFQGFFPSLTAVECFLPLGDSFEVLGYEALILRAIHSSIIMSQPFNGGNRRFTERYQHQ
jgi:hypothetical protein